MQTPNSNELPISVIIPTYRREQVLVESVGHLLEQLRAGDELILVDQTEVHEPETDAKLNSLASSARIRWLRRAAPSIPAAMNAGLLAARNARVVFLDDDIEPFPDLLDAHRGAARGHPEAIIAGRILQPWHSDGSRPLDGFAAEEERNETAFMGGNVAFDRSLGVRLGGFDEQFSEVAYCFEADFALRALRCGTRIRFVPAACIRHLRTGAGGTRSYGDHLRTFRSGHAIGEYYYALVNRPKHWPAMIMRRLLGSWMTRHHLKRPWWIPVCWFAEAKGLGRALAKVLQGRRLIENPDVG